MKIRRNISLFFVILGIAMLCMSIVGVFLSNSTAQLGLSFVSTIGWMVIIFIATLDADNQEELMRKNK